MTDRKVFAWALAGLIGAKLLLMVLGARQPQNPLDFLRPVDDAYISYRYAQNLAHGEGLVYNAGERVEGGTSIALIALLAPFSLVGIARIDLIAVLLSLLAAAGTVTLAARFMRERKDAAFGSTECFVLVFLSISVTVLVWAWAGMEASILSLAWLAAVMRHLRERDGESGWPWASALLTVCAGWLHPDGILIAPILGLSWLIPFQKKSAQRGVAYGGMVVAVFGAYWAWRWHYFGYPMPNTFYAKVGSGAAALRAGWVYVRVALFSTLVPLAVVFYAVRRAKHWREWPRYVFLFLGLALLYSLYVMKVGGDFYPFHRFYVATLPGYALVLWRLRSDDRAQRGRTDAPWSRGLIAKTILLVAAMNVWAYFYTFQGLIHRDLQRVVKNFAAVGQTLRTALPDSATIAALPIGAVGFFSEHRIHDMMGLVDLHIARVQIDDTRGVVGHQKFDHAYTLSTRPELLMVLPSLYPDDDAGFDRWVEENALAPTQYRIYEQPQLRTDYRLAKLPVGSRVAYGFLRSDLPGSPGYERWQVLDAAHEDKAYTTPQRAATHVLHGKSFGIWTFK